MFFTQIKLNTSRRSTIRLLDNRQNLHAAVLSGFPDYNREESKVLWRLDDNSRHEILIFVVSDKRPDFTNFWENYGWGQLNYSETVKTVDYTRLLTAIENGQSWGFRLKANTIKQQNGKKIALDEKDVNSWIERKSKDNGFTLVDFSSITAKSSFKKRKDSKSKVTLQETVFEGVLKVDSVEIFKQALINGIGGAKGYGCGLLTISK